ncbi:MAG: type II toxin-antitoxin system prevent-host-death family antitoxin [Gammaproteobacteria bacterium]|nr:type II toxin-antitoxin system prevent-host-death family antitoxin [Gammaproteobacteria bacterium]
MRQVGAFQAKTHLSELLDAASRGETISITKRGRPVARLVPPEAPDRSRATEAAKNLRALRAEAGWATPEKILEMRDEGRR